jgi:hypothetical protein
MKIFNRPRILIAGPWLNELGWELMVWQAAVRYRRILGRYEKVYVITFRNRDALYEGCEIYAHQEELINADSGISKSPQEKTDRLVGACVKHFGITEPYDLFTPNKYISRLYGLRRRFKNDMLHRKFYMEPVDDMRFDIAFHFRSFERVGDKNPKSFPHNKADQLVELCVSNNLKICCIGAQGYSYVAKKAENRQSDDLSKTIAYMCASRLVVGGSSAPMHLAAICGIPIAVWIGIPGDDRYFTIGNPLHSKVFMVTDKTFAPEVDEVYNTIKQAIL